MGTSQLGDNLLMTSVIHATPDLPEAEARADAPLTWRNRFAKLGTSFYTRLQPQPLPDPVWVSRNQALAREMGLDAQWFESSMALEALTGNRTLPGSDPLASVYSGHQFGQWAGQLGGRAVLRSSIREYLCSEAMHALGIPTTRALCVTGSDAKVRREEIETAAVVTRTAPSFIRFGHFEHFSYNDQHDALKTLADYVIDNFYPACRDASQPYAALLEAVSERTAHLMAGWQAVGFCHGVMNTDNMSILGLTIDYGPFQFLDAFEPGHVCNHSDTQGRYAYNKQPNIAYWNLFCLGQALLPLIGDQEQALAALEARMRAKLGLADAQPDDKALIESTFKLLASNKVDYTIFWRRLCGFTPQNGHEAVRDLFFDRESFNAWALHYSERLTQADTGLRADLMLKNNPKYVLRNHLGEQAIRTAKLNDFAGVNTLLAVLQSPFEEHADHEGLAGFPPDWAASIEISCSS